MKQNHWVEVARLEELPAGTVRGAKVNGRMLALANVGGAVYALDGICPHRRGPLWQGDIWQGQLECPWHHFRYDPATGANTFPANVYPDDLPALREQIAPIEVFLVRVEGGKIFVNLAGSRGN